MGLGYPPLCQKLGDSADELSFDEHAARVAIAEVGVDIEPLVGMAFLLTRTSFHADLLGCRSFRCFITVLEREVFRAILPCFVA